MVMIKLCSDDYIAIKTGIPVSDFFANEANTKKVEECFKSILRRMYKTVEKMDRQTNESLLRFGEFNKKMWDEVIEEMEK